MKGTAYTKISIGKNQRIMKKNFEWEQNFYCLFSQFLHSLGLPLTGKFRGSHPKSLVLTCNADKTLQGRNQEDYLYIKKRGGGGSGGKGPQSKRG